MISFKKLHLYCLLIIVSFLSSSCASVMIDLVARTLPSLMLSTPDGAYRMVWDFKNSRMTIDNPETLEVKKVWEGASASSVKSFAFSQDSRYMTFVSEGKIKIWDFRKNDFHRILESEGEPLVADFSHDNKFIAVIDTKVFDFYLSIWDLKDGRILWRKKTSMTFPMTIDFDKELRKVAVGGTENIQVFYVRDGFLDQTIMLGKNKAADSLKYSPSGKYLSAGVRQERPEIIIWDVSKGDAKKKCELYGHTNRLRGEALMFNYNEQYLASGAVNAFEENPSKRFEAIVWDVKQCRRVNTWQEMNAIGISPDGRIFTWDSDLNKMKTFFWGGEWLFDITGQNMFKSINELVSDLASGPEETQKNTIAITDFSPVSVHPTSLERFLSEEFITRITLTQTFNVVERSQISRIMTELKLSLSDFADPQYVKQTGKLLGADYLLIGTITDVKFGLKVNARIINTETGEVYKASSTTIFKDPVVRKLLEG